jgi:hypothetical protein
MKDKHIINILESAPLASLSEDDLTAIRAHTGECSGCRQAFEAVQISALLLKERVAETFEPSPFFHTRVLATLRESRIASEPWAWSRIWRATGALASSMVATVAALAVLTFVVPETQTELLEATSARNAYSAEEVILNQGELLDDQISDSHVLTTLYEIEEDALR